MFGILSHVMSPIKDQVRDEGCPGPDWCSMIASLQSRIGMLLRCASETSDVLGISAEENQTAGKARE